MEDWSQFAPVDSVESFDQFEEVKDSTKLPSLPEVPSDTPVDYSFVGFVGGEATHTLTIPELPSHTHDFISYIQSGSNSGSGGEPAGYFSTIPTAPTGSGVSHNNMQPYIVTLMIMKL